MTDKFEFVVPVPVVKVGDTRIAEASFDVTSHLGRHGRVGVEVVPEEGADPAWFKPVQPQEFDLPDGQTAKVTVPIAAPGAPAGTSRFHVRAYAIDRPQNDFAASPAWVLEMLEIKKPSGPPKWLLAVIAAVVVIVLGLGAFLFFRGEDTSSVVGQTLAEAQDALGDFDVVVTEDGSVRDDPALDCVLFQQPGDLTADDIAKVGLFAVRCPPSSPNLPDIAVDVAGLCADLNTFCQQLATDVGPGFATDAALLEELTAQAADFVGAFRLDGTTVPQVIGLTVDEARAAIESTGLDVVVDDGLVIPADGAGCVLFQQPSAGRLQVVDGAVTVVQVGCPERALSPETVAVSTDINLVNYLDICDVAEELCQSVLDQADLGPLHFTTEVWIETLDTQETLFRGTFTIPTVPDLIGKGPSEATSLLVAVQLSLQVVGAGPENFSCPVVQSQFTAAGTRVEDLGGATAVGVTFEEGGGFGGFCLFLPKSQVNFEDFVLINP